MSKAFETSRVPPFLYKVRKSELTGPLSQFQATSADRDDVLKLLSGINASCGDSALDAVRLAKVFEVWWPDLEARLGKITPPVVQSGSSETERSSGEVLEEVLELVRGQQRLLSTPGALLPPEYLQSIVPILGAESRTRGSTFTFFDILEDISIAAGHRARQARYSVIVVSGLGQLTSTKSGDMLSTWVGQRGEARTARRLMSPVMDDETITWLRNTALEIRNGYSVRVMSRRDAVAIGRCSDSVIDGAEAGVVVPLLGGGFISNDDHLVSFLSDLFESHWAAATDVNEYLQTVIERQSPNEQL